MHQILFQKEHVPGPLLGRDFLWFYSLKRPFNPCIFGSGWLLKQHSASSSGLSYRKVLRLSRSLGIELQQETSYFGCMMNPFI